VSYRILLLDTGKEWGGGTNSMLELLKRIDRQRFQVDALFYSNYAKGKHSDLRRELAAIGIPLHVPHRVRQPAWAKLLKELARALLFFSGNARRRAIRAIDDHWHTAPRVREIATRLDDDQFDLLYLNNQPSSNREGYSAAARAGVPAVQHCRSTPALTPAEVAMVNRDAARVICVSRGLVDALAAQGVREDLLRVVCNGIDLGQPLPDALRPAGAPPDALVIGTVGRLQALKAVDHLIRAVAQARQRFPRRLHLSIVGDGEERGQLEQLAAQLGMQDCVSFAGFQAQPLPLVAGMDVVALCSEKEGLPRVVLEAMLLGKPVIASQVPGSQELVVDGRTGILYPFGDIDALAAALLRLADDAQLRASMGAAGHARLQANYSIENYVAGVEQVFAEVLE